MKAGAKRWMERWNEANRRSMQMTDREVAATVQAMNLFFGAVIGFILADIQDIATRDYVIVLIITVSVVMAILWLSQSHRRLYSVFSLAISLGLYAWVDLANPAGFGDNIPDKMLPTLAVWSMLAVGTEFRMRMEEPEKAA